MRSCGLKMTINNILNNKTYTGRIVHNGSKLKGFMNRLYQIGGEIDVECEIGLP